MEWSTTDAESVLLEIDPPPLTPEDYDPKDEMMASGTLGMTADLTTTFTLVVTDENGQVAKSMKVATATDETAELNDFTVNDDSTPGNVQVTFTWTANHVEDLTLMASPGGDITSAITGSTATHTPNITTTYTLTAEGKDESKVTRSVMVTVTSTPVTPPAVTSFTIDGGSTATAVEGAEVTLAWVTTNATSVTITATPGENISTENQPAYGGMVMFTPGVGTTTYNLKASGPGGSADATAVSVTVTQAPVAGITSFTAISQSTPHGDYKAAVMLTWVTTDAAEISIMGPGGSVDLEDGGHHGSRARPVGSGPGGRAQRPTCSRRSRRERLRIQWNIPPPWT